MDFHFPTMCALRIVIIHQSVQIYRQNYVYMYIPSSSMIVTVMTGKGMYRFLVASATISKLSRRRSVIASLIISISNDARVSCVFPPR